VFFRVSGSRNHHKMGWLSSLTRTLQGLSAFRKLSERHEFRLYAYLGLTHAAQTKKRSLPSIGLIVLAMS
jgi:hypothetical protein